MSSKRETFGRKKNRTQTFTIERNFTYEDTKQTFAMHQLHLNGVRAVRCVEFPEYEWLKLKCTTILIVLCIFKYNGLSLDSEVFHRNAFSPSVFLYFLTLPNNIEMRSNAVESLSLSLALSFYYEKTGTC